MKAGFHDPQFAVPIAMEVVREAKGLSYDQVASAFEYGADGKTIKGLDTAIEFGSDHILDSLFFLRLPCEDGVKEVYLNIEGQASRGVPYNLRDRAAIYLCGMMCRQKDRSGDTAASAGCTQCGYCRARWRPAPTPGAESLRTGCSGSRARTRTRSPPLGPPKWRSYSSAGRMSRAITPSSGAWTSGSALE